MCGCQTAAALQSHPGNGEIPAIPDGGDPLLAWRAAQEVLRGACSYGTDLMTYESLEMAGNVLPADWSFEEKGAW
eukprot:3145577-Pleurochrysis_carterae.AAC.1